jgi:hypothetical protein
MGIPGIGPQHYLALLANEGIQLQPDMVIVSFFIGNDFTDAMFKRKTKFYQYFAVATLIKFFIDLNRKYEGRVIHVGASYDDNAPSFTEEAYLNLEKNRSLIYMKRKPFKKEFADVIGYLVRIKQLCDQNMIALRVVIIPDELQVNPVLQAKVLKALNTSSDELDFTLPNRFLNEQLKVHRIDHVDLLDDFSSASAQTNLYKPNNSHWNIAGNKLAADILTRYISSQLSR